MLPLNSPMERNTLCGLLAILIWSTSIALARSITEQVGSLTAAAAVHLVGGAFCLAHLLLTSKGRMNQIRHLSAKYLLGCGGLFVLYMLSLFMAVGLAADRHQVLEIGLINYLWPALTIFLSLVLLKKKANLILIPGTFLALLGVFLVLTQGQPIFFTSLLANVTNNPMAYSLALVAAISWGLYSNLTHRWTGKESGGAVQLFVPATGLIFLVLLMFHGEGGSWTWRAGLEVTFMGLATAFAYILWEIAMRKGNIIFVAACSYLTPLFSTLLSCVYLQIKPGLSLWLGCVLIVGGSLLSWAAVSPSPHPSPPARGRC